MRIGIAAILTMMLTALPAGARQVQIPPSINPKSVEFISFSSLDGRASPITGYLLRPEGAGPFAAVIALHGCGGLLKQGGIPLKKMVAWAERLLAAGYAVLYPDSFASRDLGSLCGLSDRPLKPPQRAADAAGAAAWLARQSYIDSERIALLGWSNGGTTVLWALQPDRWPSGVRFAAAIAFYPWCRNLLKHAHWRPKTPLTILIGSSDDWTPPEPCKQLTERWGSRLVIYEGAYHSFDHPSMERELRTGVALSKRGDGLAIAGTDPAARKDAIDEILRLLKGR